MSLEDSYRLRLEGVLLPLARALEAHFAAYFAEEPRIDRVTARAKAIDRFLAKAQKRAAGAVKYSEPLLQIQDQVGVRIVTFYTTDIQRVSGVVERYFRLVESKTLIPESDWEFGYFGKHYVLHVPTDVIDCTWAKEQIPDFFELQVKTLFQHAWAEANHDLGYKPDNLVVGSEAKRKLAFASAQAWGADQIFNDLFAESEAAVRTG